MISCVLGSGGGFLGRLSVALHRRRRDRDGARAHSRGLLEQSKSQLWRALQLVLIHSSCNIGVSSQGGSADPQGLRELFIDPGGRWCRHRLVRARYRQRPLYSIGVHVRASAAVALTIGGVRMKKRPFRE